MGWSAFRKTGLTYHQPAASAKGYTLLTPMAGEATYLIDMAGQVVHLWRHTRVKPFYARLLPTGTLGVIGVDVAVQPPELPPGAIPSFSQNIRRLGGNATHLIELDWDGNVVWEYANEAIHHDFARLPNGNTLLPEWVELAADVARGVRGGHRVAEKLPAMLSDDIIEVSPKGDEVRRIHLWQLLDPRRDPICPMERRREWTHVNGLDLTREGDIVFSCRENSRVGRIDGKSGALAWKLPAGTTSHQHHPSVLANGNLQLFDNGQHAEGWTRSRVIEVNPKDNAIVWQYEADPPYSFFSSHISGAERQPGGNVLICEGGSGRIFEITPKGETVWEWLSPFSQRVNGILAHRIFRAHRYTADHPALSGRELDPGRHRDVNRMYGLDA